MHIIVANNSIQPTAFDAPADSQPVPQRLPASGTTAVSPARQQMLECSVGQLLRHLHPGMQGEARQVRMAFAQQELRVFARVAECCVADLAAGQHEQLREQQRASEGVLFGNLPAQLSLGVQADVPFFDKLIELIGVIRDDYLNVYEHVLDVYTKFYAAFTDQITSKMSGWFEADKDGKKIIFQRATFESALNSLLQQFEYQPSQLVPIPGAAPMSEDEARNWQRALGLPEHCLNSDGDGNWAVYMDTAPVIAILQGLPPSGPGGLPAVIDTAKFNAWQSGFNAQEERLKNMLQSITSKYANTYHDNFNKTLSSHLNQFADLLKHMTTL